MCADENRAVNLGNPSRSLATQEPHPSTPLPAADELWDSGVSVSLLKLQGHWAELIDTGFLAW